MADITRARHFYHLCADLDWRDIAREHVDALKASSLRVPVTVGMTGTRDGRNSGEAMFRAWLPGWRLSFTGAEQGFEDVTLRAVRQWARANPSGMVLYMHAKGTLHPSVMNDRWRRNMTHRLLCGWERCTRHLGTCDAVGCHWVPDLPFGAAFGGNFWWANCSYLARLEEPVVRHDRHEAESWIGMGRPQYTDLHPGHPTGVYG